MSLHAVYWRFIHLEVLCQAKEEEALFFLNTWGKVVPCPQTGLQTSAVFTFGNGGREECLQTSVLPHLPSLLLGGADFVLTVGWAIEHRFEECLSSWPNLFIWKLAAAAAAAAIIAEFIAA